MEKYNLIKVSLALLFVTIAAAYLTSMMFSFDTGNVALIKIDGEISFSDSPFTHSVNSDEIVRMIRESESDPQIEAIYLEINSPGGSVVATRNIANSLSKAEKPVVCLLKDMAASGAYWVASACDVIIADDFTITGNLGVTGSYLEFSRLFEEYGISYVRIVSGEKKDTGTPFREASPQEIAQLQLIIDDIHASFIEEVSINRGLEIEHVSFLADGSIFTGRQAVENGLVDFVGNRETAFDVILSMTELSYIELVEFRRKVDMLDFMMDFYLENPWNILSNRIKIEAI